MPRSRGSSAPRRPSAGPARQSTAPSQQQKRPATTAAYPSSQQSQAAPSGGSGLFGQMASTAAGVAVGSSIGHAVGNMFGGGSAAAEPAPTNAVGAQSDSYSQNTATCQMDVHNFRRCMDENQGSLNICGWYLDQLKACQAAAGQY